MRRSVLASATASVLALAAAGIFAIQAGAVSAPPPSNLYGCVDGSNRVLEHVFTIQANFENYLNAHNGTCPNGFPVSVLTAPSPSPTPTPTPTPTATATAFSCVTSSPTGACPSGKDYQDSPNIIMSNGFNTYAANNCWADPSCKQTLRANSPSDWQVTSTEPAGNGSVMTGPELQQQTNNWCTSLGKWDSQTQFGCSPEGDAPISALATFTSSFAESMPHNSQTIAEAAYDIWTNYPSDIMVWTDTVGRCNEGAFGSTLLGTATIGGKNFTVHRYGGTGAEIIFVEDGAGGSGTCATDSSGTVDLKGVLQWVQDHGLVSNASVSLLDFTFEICSTGGSPETFSVSSYSVKTT
jgi:hypothetical protein